MNDSTALACPLDGTHLESAPLGDVTLHYCPECQGIWLTRQEFEQLIEQATRDARHDEPSADVAAEPSEEGGDEAAPRQSRGLRSILDDLFG